jgi:glycosyltransferase involved in cell wall biosynthesis
MPRCVTIHDTIPIKFPQYFNPVTSFEFESFISNLAVCDQIIAISDCTKNDFLDAFRLKPKRPVVVTPLAVDARFKPVKPSERNPQAIQILHQYNLLESPFILSVATLEPRKNIPSLLRAFSVAKASLPSGTKLVLVGTKGWERTDLDELVESLGIEASIVFTGYLEDESLPSLLSAASVFCYPSLYEGFGLPVLEAMSCGCPVVTSNTSSLGEFFSTSSISVDPTNIQAIAAAMATILNNPVLADELRIAGFQLSSTLTWSNLARKTIFAYKQAISLPAP